MVAVAERLAPSVASLRVMRRTRGGQVPAGAGSAVALTPDGFLLTSAHVVGRSSARGRASFAGVSSVASSVVVDVDVDAAVVRRRRTAAHVSSFIYPSTRRAMFRARAPAAT